MQLIKWQEPYDLQGSRYRWDASSRLMKTRDPYCFENFTQDLTRVLLRRENSYGLGYTTTDWMTLEINPFQYPREIRTSITKGYESYLILGNWCRSLLRFSNTLVFTILSQQQQTRQACYIFECYAYSSIYKQSCIRK